MMGILSRWRTASEASRDLSSASPARSVVASSMPLSGPQGKAAWHARSGDEGWQRQAWYYYDAIGELFFAFNLISNAMARAVPFAAEVDPETGQIGQATNDTRVQAVAQALFGGHEERAQIQSTLAIQWQVGGESFIMITPRGGGEPDRWAALSSRAVRQKGGVWQWKDPLTGAWVPTGSRDKLIRVWSPHPDELTHANSAMRPAIPICSEIEKTSQAIQALLDSRIGSNGLLFIPQEIDFPVGEGEQANALNFMRYLMEAMEASLATPGSAAARVPLTAQVPGELIGQIQHMDLATELDSALTTLREAAVERLGRTLDMPREMALGQQAESNHWSGWLVDETTYKLHLEPFLLKLGAAITRDYFREALRLMGVADPERYVIDWDISALVGRPDEAEKLGGLHDKGLISDEWYVQQLGIPDDARPDDEEVFLKRLERVVIGAPTLAADAEVANRLFGFEIAPAAAGVAPVAAEEPALEADNEEPVRAIPARAESSDGPDEGLVAAAELVVFDALSRAGGRLLTRQYRGQFGSTPKHELHTVIGFDRDDLDKLCEGSFQFTDRIAEAFGRDPVKLGSTLRLYVDQRLLSQLPHDRKALRQVLS